MMVFPAVPAPKRALAWLLWLLLFAGAGFVDLWLWRTPPGPAWVQRFLLVLLLWGLWGWLGYRIWLLHSLRYRLDRDALRITTAISTLLIPLPDIDAMHMSPSQMAERRRWWHWPSVWLAPEHQPLIMASQPPTTCIEINTARQGVVLISPARPRALMQAIRARQQLGPARRLKPQRQVAPWRQHWLWQQRLPQLGIGLAALALLGISLYLIWRFPGLPADLALHFNTAGIPDRFAPRGAIFIFPLILALIWLTNTVLGLWIYQRQRLAALMLWAGALAWQGLGWVVLQNLLP